jgi:hypothetical protein
VTEANGVESILLDVARRMLVDLQQRSAEALKALQQHDYLVVLGALAGLDEQIRFLIVRLMVLREIKQMRKQKLDIRRKS